MPHIRIKLKQNKLIRFRDIKSLNNEKILETLINRAFPGTRSSI